MDTDAPQANPPKARLAALINGLLSVAVAGFISLDSDPFSNLFEVIAGPALLLLGAVYLGRALSSKPEIEIGPEGLVHRCSRFPGELMIPWEQMVDADPGLLTRDVLLEVESRRALIPDAAPLRKVELVLGGLLGRPNSLALRPPLGMNRTEFVDLINARSLLAEQERLALTETSLEAPKGPEV